METTVGRPLAVGVSCGHNVKCKWQVIDLSAGLKTNLISVMFSSRLIPTDDDDDATSSA